MCGIAGIVRFDQPGSECLPALRDMVRSLRHRGPDDQQVRAFSFAALGNTRLAFVDRLRGAQPMTDGTGRWSLTWNGELYNHEELRAELADRWQFRTQSDSEVVLAACALLGADALPRLNGMFALFLWDDLRQVGFAARDRLGVKPFAWRQVGAEFAFASEARALLRSRPRAEFGAVLEYLVAPFFSGVEHAMFVGIEYLAPGQLLRVDRAGVRVETWWDWTPVEEAEAGSEALAAQVQRAVRRTLQGESPCAVFLSGGLDSTLLAALAKPETPPAFTIAFEGQHAFDYAVSRIVRDDDTPHAAAAARELGLAHEIVPVRRATLAADLRRLATINDALPAWEQELAQHHLARAVSATHRAVLVGDAADETHYGYPFLLDPEVVRTPGNILSRFGSPELAAGVTASFDAKYREVAESAGWRWDTPVAQLCATTYLIVKRWLPRLLHNGDVHTMAFSVEARVPLADIELVETARRAPPARALGKQLLREAARGLMPEGARLRAKSALPKDQATAAVYQQEARIALEESADFLGAWLALAPLRELASTTAVLTENERSLLFRVIALHHWRCAFNVGQP